MQMLNVSYFFSFTAGILSVLSPCVLPLLPIIVAGKAEESKLRPLLIVLGLTITFVFMGIVSTLFGHLVSPFIYSIEKISGGIIILFGLLMCLDINLLKKLTFFQKINYQGKGTFSGLILGMVLGLIWIPCVGPVLSSILVMVATSGSLQIGILSLLLYSLGFSIPLLVAAYAAHFFRTKLSGIKRFPSIVRYLSGSLLIVFGTYICFYGLLNFSLP